MHTCSFNGPTRRFPSSPSITAKHAPRTADLTRKTRASQVRFQARLGFVLTSSDSLRHFVSDPGWIWCGIIKRQYVTILHITVNTFHFTAPPQTQRMRRHRLPKSTHARDFQLTSSRASWQGSSRIWPYPAKFSPKIIERHPAPILTSSSWHNFSQFLSPIGDFACRPEPDLEAPRHDPDTLLAPSALPECWAFPLNTRCVVQ